MIIEPAGGSLTYKSMLSPHGHPTGIRTRIGGLKGRSPYLFRGWDDMVTIVRFELNILTLRGLYP